jgi:hypothetical protein
MIFFFFWISYTYPFSLMMKWECVCGLLQALILWSWMLAADIYFVLPRLILLRCARLGTRVCLTLFWQQLVLKMSRLHMNLWLQIVKISTVKSCCQCGAGEPFYFLVLPILLSSLLITTLFIPPIFHLMPYSRQLTCNFQESLDLT